MKESFSSIKVTIFLGLFIAISIPISIAGIYTINLNKQKLYEKFELSREQITSNIANSMIQPLYNFSPNNGSLALEIIKQNIDIIKIEIYDEVSEADFITINIPSRNKADTFKNYQNISLNGESLGWLEVTYSDYRLKEELNETKKFLIRIFGFTFLALFSIMYPLLYFKVLSPLKRLLKQSQDFKNNTFEKRYFWKEADEIGQVGRTLDLARNSVEGTKIKLIEAKNKAEKETKVKSEFLANMSHEIRTPINGILGLTKLILNTKIDEKQKNYLQKINHSSESLLNIINDILDYSKMEVGKFRLENRDFSLKEMITIIEGLFLFYAKNKGIKLSFEIEKSTPTFFRGDNLRLQQIFNNLISNALKFTNDGEIKVSIKTKAIIKNKVELFVCVEDTGIGINKQDKEKIFKSFEQADNSNTRKHGGTGLGLSITKQIIELMNGKIWLESEEKKGSKFYFTAILEYKENLKESSQEKNTLQLQANAYVLLVEDNEINQIVAAENLRTYGLNVDIASNGLEALQKLQEKIYDLIFMDIQMPIMDGLETTKEIRKKNIKTPIIALSAAAMKEDKQKAKDIGIDDYISKPIIWSEVEKVLQRYLETNYKEILPLENPLEEDLIQIDGLDIKKITLALKMKPQRVYLLLENFKNSYKDFDKKINNMDWDSKEFDEYIHKLKGVSGNLQIDNIYTITQKIEQDKQNRDKLLINLSNILKTITQSIEEKLSKNKIPDKNEKIDDKQLIEKIDLLITDIDEFNFIDSLRINKLVEFLYKLDEKQKNDILQSFEENDYDKLKELLLFIKKDKYAQE